MSFTGCGKCRNGYIESEEHKGCLEECECHKAYRLEKQLEKKFKKSGLPKVEMTLHDLYVKRSGTTLQKVNHFIEHFEDQNMREAVLYFYGSYGTQKTTTAAIVGREILKQGYSVRFLTMQALLDDLWSFEEHEDFSKYDLLILDECFDNEKLRLYSEGSVNQISQIEIFLRTRIQIQKKATILISNIKPSLIAGTDKKPSDKKEAAKKYFTESCCNFICREINLRSSLLEFKDSYINDSLQVDLMFKSEKIHVVRDNNKQAQEKIKKEKVKEEVKEEAVKAEEPALEVKVDPEKQEETQEAKVEDSIEQEAAS